MKNLPVWVRQHLAALRAMLVLTVALGVVYPLVMTAVAQIATPGRADGSLVKVAGKVVGSKLLGQSFSDGKGNPLPQWFQPRPSATSYDSSTSGGSNYGPEAPELIKAIKELRDSVAKFDSVPGHPVRPADVPPDAVTASASGLDPDISVAYAQQQAYRVAYHRHLDAGRVLALVNAHIDKPTVGVFGTKVVNVLELNLALSRMN
ncbi:MAG: potassium-transporting ATPase subunit KdpC [Jatrophihabitans sp.]